MIGRRGEKTKKRQSELMKKWDFIKYSNQRIKKMFEVIREVYCEFHYAEVEMWWAGHYKNERERDEENLKSDKKFKEKI
jgi:hypothetical protein